MIEPVRECVTSADGTKISYLRVGRGPSLVIVPGGLSDATSWLQTAELLAPEYEVFLVDLRGHGESEEGDEVFSIARVVDDVRAVLAAAGPGAILLGHSYGGVVALETALATAPGEVRQLLSYEAALPGAIPDRAVFERVQSMVETGDLVKALEIVLFEVAHVLPEEAALAAEQPGSPSLEELAARVPGSVREAFAVYALEGATRYRALTIPTVFLLGEQSAPEFASKHEELLSLVPGSTAAVFPGQRHNANLFDPLGTLAVLHGVLQPLPAG